MKKGLKSDIEITYENPSKVFAPMEKGTCIGKVYLSKDGVLIKEINLVLGQTLEKISYKDCLDKIVDVW